MDHAPRARKFCNPYDQNKEEPTRYADINSCDWIVDLQEGECAPSDARAVHSAPFLDASKTSALHRILYVPFLHEAAVQSGQVQYQNYVLYKLN